MDPNQYNMGGFPAGFGPGYPGPSSTRPRPTGNPQGASSASSSRTAYESFPAATDPSAYPEFDLSQHIRKPDPAIPDFIVKLWQVLIDPIYRGTIDWDETGTALVFSDSPACRDLIIKLFRRQTKPGDPGTSHMSSFIRNLNNYGFSKVTNRLGPDRTGPQYGGNMARTTYETLMFRNENFQKGQPSKLSLIKSKKKIQMQLDNNVIPQTAAPGANIPPTGAQPATSPNCATREQLDELRSDMTEAMQQLENRVMGQIQQLSRVLGAHDQNSRAQYANLSQAFFGIAATPQPTRPMNIFSPPSGPPPGQSGSTN